jgi:hypothetical protein
MTPRGLVLSVALGHQRDGRIRLDALKDVGI